MVDNRMEEWARHYDNLLWTVTAIFLAANGALLVHCTEEGSFNPGLALGGMFLTVLTVYFAASFRELRHRVGELVDEDLFRVLSTGRRLYQWPAFLLLFAVFIFGWSALLWQYAPAQRCWWALAGILAMGFSIALGFRFRGSAPRTRRSVPAGTHGKNEGH